MKDKPNTGNRKRKRTLDSNNSRNAPSTSKSKLTPSSSSSLNTPTHKMFLREFLGNMDDISDISDMDDEPPFTTVTHPTKSTSNIEKSSVLKNTNKKTVPEKPTEHCVSNDNIENQENEEPISDLHEQDSFDSCSLGSIPEIWGLDENGELKLNLDMIAERNRRFQNKVPACNCEMQRGDTPAPETEPEENLEPELTQRGGEVNIRNLYEYKLEDEYDWNDLVHKKRYKISFSKEMGRLTADNHELFGAAILDMSSRIAGTNPNTKMGIAITPKNGETLFVHPRGVHQFSTNFLDAEFENIMQSARHMNAAGHELEVTVTFLDEISGSGRRRGAFPVFKKLAGQPGLFQQSGGNIQSSATAPAIAPATATGPAQAVQAAPAASAPAPPGPATNTSGACPIPVTATEKRRGTFTNNVESYCLGTAVARGIAHILLKEDRTNQDRVRKVDRWKKVRSDKPTVSPDCWQDAKDILTTAGITKSRDFTLDDVRKIQQSLRGRYQLIVLNEDCDPQPVYAGGFVSRGRIIPLLYKRGHFELIFSLPKFVGAKHYCTICFVHASSEQAHYNCPQKCSKCLSDACQRTGTYDITCGECGIHFTSRRCYTLHKQLGRQGGMSRCQCTRKCNKCRQSYYIDRGIKHECGTSYCQACKCVRERGHTHTLGVSAAPRTFSEKRLFFDLETMEVEDANGMKKHKVVLACALRCCSQCRNEIPTSRENALTLQCHFCSPDGNRYKEVDCFDDPTKDVMDEFVTWLLSAHHTGFVVLAHNMKGYDGQLLLEYAFKPHFPKPQKLILCGRKVNLINICGMKVIDSYNFVPFALAKFSKAFNVPEITKGEFPFRFIKEANFVYNGPMPDKSYYAYEEKNKEAKTKFDVFYNQKVADGYVFNFKKDIRDYCFSDVALLSAAMVKFELEFLEKTNVMLFEEAVTAAGAALTTFQRNFVQPNTMALDADPSSTRIKQSAIARRFIAYLQTEENNAIQCVDNIGEFQIPGTQFHVDGYIPRCTKYPRGMAIEFYGDYYHAHSCMYGPNQIVRGTDRAIDIRQRDADREARIKQFCDLTVFWECEVQAEARTNKKLAAMLDQNLAHGPVVCREGLFGGRTEAIRLAMDADRNRELHYLDFTSLYPFVMKTCRYPVGEGRRILGRDIQCPITTVHQLEAACQGYMSCKVVPPEKLFIPVLPYRSHKLLFTLCRTCGEKGLTGKCPHTDDERALYGTWTTVELELAVQKGYRIEQVYGAVHWDQWTSELFKDYINTFLREKQEASGWPSWVQNDADRQRYIDDYEAREGIRLDIRKIKKDEVTRQVAKLLLNSLWGKFGQRVDVPSTHIVTTPTQLYRIMNNPTLEIHHIEIHNSSTITVQTRAVPGTLQSLKSSCIQYAILTTAHARCTLYKALDLIPDPEKNLCYMDTDSVIFAADRSSGNPLATLTGEYLGQLTSELSGEMKCFVTVGAKSYAYIEKLPNGEEKTSVKAKGFTMNADAERKIDYRLMRRQVDEVITQSPIQTEAIVRYQSIKRTSTHSLINVEILKKFKFTFDKRQVLDGGATVPFGFERV